MLARLPQFVSTDPDKMPSIKLCEGDMAMVMLKLGKMDEKISTLKGSVDKIGTMAKQHPMIQTQSVHPPSRTCPSLSAAAPGMAERAAPHLGPPTIFAATSAATAGASARRDSESDVRTTDIDEASDNGAWSHVAAKKRRRQMTSPSQTAAGGEPITGRSVAVAGETGRGGSLAVAPRPQSTQPIKKVIRKSLIGASSTSALHAAKSL